MFEVIYCSKGGNTRKVAEAIAAELGITAEDVTAKKGLSEGSFVFLGSGCYNGQPGEELQEFIAQNDFKEREVAIFGTSGGGGGKEVSAIEELLKPKGALIRGSFHCLGEYSSYARGHPTNEELANAREFASKVKNG